MVRFVNTIKLWSHTMVERDQDFYIQLGAFSLDMQVE